MRYVRLGASGLTVSRIGLGMMSVGDRAWRPWVLDEDAAEPIVRRAAEAGITFFDTANHYSGGVSEQITGRVLRKIFTRRDDYVIATKVGSVIGPGPHDRGLSRTHILTAIDDSLRRLGTDYVDLYQIHRWDPHTPIEETVETLHDVVHAGKIRYLGAGSMYAWQFAKAHHTATRHGHRGFISMQDHYNLLYREEEREMIPLCRDIGVGVIPWSPLARGLLTRTRDTAHATLRSTTDEYARQLYTPADLSTVDALTAVADRRALPPAQVALAWLLGKPGITAPIIGATKGTHIDDAVAALDIALDDADVKRLEASYRPHPIRGHE
ncbi:aldo/keto reductase [Frankia sp. Cr1]|uniref:aldo/keto reductase n=1 Tax=Frankia sp. Cr1 TaxID=3073931 RepID=UPI002AD39D63|nr:aldo/keto reductase [Frankia sp. Cr1]